MINLDEFITATEECGKRLLEGRPDFYTVGLRIPHRHERSSNSAIRSWWESGIAEEPIAKK